jgi:hypothetical protein
MPRKSRGPRTTAGKRAASRSALRHGLAAINRNNAALLPEIEALAQAICNGETDPLLWEQAVIMAETQLILQCVRIVRIAAIERMHEPKAVLFAKGDVLVQAKAVFEDAKRRYEQLVEARTARNAARAAAENEAAARSQADRAARPFGVTSKAATDKAPDPPADPSSTATSQVNLRRQGPSSCGTSSTRCAPRLVAPQESRPSFHSHQVRHCRPQSPEGGLAQDTRKMIGSDCSGSGRIASPPRFLRSPLSGQLR